MNNRLNILLNFALIFCSFIPVYGKETKVNMTKTVVYVGEANKKVPSGVGTLYVMSAPSKTFTAKQDVISGSFDGNKVSNATIVFSSGWHFEGDASYSVTELDKKTGITETVYNLSGLISNKDNTFSCKVKEIALTRVNTLSGDLDLNVLPFKATREDSNGNDIDFLVSINSKDLEWSVDAQQIVCPAVYFKGASIEKCPQGFGYLTVQNNDCFDESNAKDIVKGVFENNHVSDAHILFSSGFTFDGVLDYNVNVVSNNPYNVEVGYVLYGKLMDEKNTLVHRCDSLVIIRELSSGKLKLDPVSISYEATVPVELTRQYFSMTQSNSASCIKNLKIIESDKWHVYDSYSSNEPEFTFNNGFVITKTDSGFICQYPNLDYFVVENGYVVDFLKTFNECRVHQTSPSADIVYFNGDVYRGTFIIGDFGAKTEYKEELVKRFMTGPSSINDVPLYYQNGEYTYEDGKHDTWENGLTDYQINKRNGNYDRALAAAQEYIQEEKRAAGRELEEKWQKALPELRAEFNSRDVDAIYEYRLNKGTNLELFLRLNELGLINLSPFFIKTGSSKRQYAISVYNRQTGEIQYSQMILFRHPNRYSTSWVLEKYSSDIM